MFTGIIEETGTIKSMKRNGANTDLVINAKKVLEGTKIGDSIAVNGVCLTVTGISSSAFQAFAMGETMRRTAFSKFRAGSRVNLERALLPTERMGGHIVSGHIDGTGEIMEKKPEGEAVWIRIKAPQNIMKYVVEKGSIAIDGISLTVAGVTGGDFSVSIIPHTGIATTLTTKEKGDPVNLENDIIGKYVERLVNFKADRGLADAIQKDSAYAHRSKASDPIVLRSEGSLTVETLTKNGFI
ncbi:MAG: riboflavin synthase [Lachnospiraceae bacterium]|jgi:riboflavin synthase|nr:riboflavin synthase [Lachnospiraceae bacterium]MEE3460690.1 riboflavin synthase [Lachnospiraceae bacterium]